MRGHAPAHTFAHSRARAHNRISRSQEELDFQGFVTSDWAAMIDGVQPALAGADMNMPGFVSYNIPPSEPNPDNTTNSRVFPPSLVLSVRVLTFGV